MLTEVMTLLSIVIPLGWITATVAAAGENPAESVADCHACRSVRQKNAKFKVVRRGCAECAKLSILKTIFELEFILRHPNEFHYKLVDDHYIFEEKRVTLYELHRIIMGKAKRFDEVHRSKLRVGKLDMYSITNNPDSLPKIKAFLAEKKAKNLEDVLEADKRRLYHDLLGGAIRADCESIIDFRALDIDDNLYNLIIGKKFSCCGTEDDVTFEECRHCNHHSIKEQSFPITRNYVEKSVEDYIFNVHKSFSNSSIRALQYAASSYNVLMEKISRIGGLVESLQRYTDMGVKITKSMLLVALTKADRAIGEYLIHRCKSVMPDGIEKIPNMAELIGITKEQFDTMPKAQQGLLMEKYNLLTEPIRRRNAALFYEAAELNPKMRNLFLSRAKAFAVEVKKAEIEIKKAPKEEKEKFKTDKSSIVNAVKLSYLEKALANQKEKMTVIDQELSSKKCNLCNSADHFHNSCPSKKPEEKKGKEKTAIPKGTKIQGNRIFNPDGTPVYCMYHKDNTAHDSLHCPKEAIREAAKKLLTEGRLRTHRIDPKNAPHAERVQHAEHGFKKEARPPMFKEPCPTCRGPHSPEKCFWLPQNIGHAPTNIQGLYKKYQGVVPDWYNNQQRLYKSDKYAHGMVMAQEGLAPYMPPRPEGPRLQATTEASIELMVQRAFERGLARGEQNVQFRPRPGPKPKAQEAEVGIKIKPNNKRYEGDVSRKGTPKMPKQNIFKYLKDA